jgi:hypothetical protein
MMKLNINFPDFPAVHVILKDESMCYTYFSVFGRSESVKADIASFVSVISFHGLDISLRKPWNMNVVSVL